MVGALGMALPNVAGASAVSLSVPSGVVTQTCAVTGAGPAAAYAPAARVVAVTATPAAPSEAMTILIRAIVVPSCNKMKQIRNLLCPVANQRAPGLSRAAMRSRRAWSAEQALGHEGLGQGGGDGGERALVGEPVVGHAGHRAGYGVLVGEAVLGPAV